MMNSKGSIAIVIALLALLASPLLYTAVGNGLFAKAPAPQLAKAVNAKECVEPADWMRANHMKLLVHQRDLIVREGEHNHKYHIEGCGTCHTKRAEFCDRCHTYAGAKPECFDCHYLP